VHRAVASGRAIILAGKSSSSPGEGVAANPWCLSVNAMYVNADWKRPLPRFFAVTQRICGVKVRRSVYICILTSFRGGHPLRSQERTILKSFPSCETSIIDPSHGVD